MCILAISACAASLTACASYGAAPEAPDNGMGPRTCNAEAAQYHVGHDATQEMGAAIVKDSGAQTLRWGAPNSAWTMDYRQDRVNVRYDAAMKIVEITCG